MKSQMRNMWKICPMIGLWTLGILLLSLGCSKQMQYPVEYVPPAEFLMGPEDVLSVTVWKNQDLSREMIIRPDGIISLPVIGDVHASGLTANQLAKEISNRLAEYMDNPTVSVQIREVNSYYVYVLGEVAHPGKLPLKSYTSVLQAISMVGGFNQFASENSIQVLRVASIGEGGPREVRIPVRYDDLVDGDGHPGNFILRSGDTIVVP